VVAQGSRSVGAQWISVVYRRAIGRDRAATNERETKLIDILAAAVIALAPVKQAPPSSDAPSPPCTWLDKPGG
jgi:hypothetical protein